MDRSILRLPFWMPFLASTGCDQGEAPGEQSRGRRGYLYQLRALILLSEMDEWESGGRFADWLF